MGRGMSSVEQDPEGGPSENKVKIGNYTGPAASEEEFWADAANKSAWSDQFW